MKRTLQTFILLLLATSIYSQVPLGFSYQALVRSTTGEPIDNKDVALRVSLLAGGSEGPSAYSEVHNVKTSSIGVVTINVGQGTRDAGNLAAVPWDVGMYLKVEIDTTGGSNYTVLGVTQIMSVPYALSAGGLAKGAIEVVPNADQSPDEPLFVVRNSDDQIIFAVYEDGARFNVGDRTRSRRGGFAIGGLVNQTKDDRDGVDYFSLQPDSIRFNLQLDDSKSRRGGFAIGGLVNQTKGTTVDYLTLRPDSIRFAIDESTLDKSRRGGFAIGGLVNQTKDFRNYLVVSRDTTYVTNTLATEGNVQIGGDVAVGGDVTSTDVKDADGNVYPTIRIGNQVWMAKNLRTTRYNTGNPIEVGQISGKLPYFYPLDTAGYDVGDLWFERMGYFYNLQEMDFSNICPTGWRLPSESDWIELLQNSGGPQLASDRLKDPVDWWPHPESQTNGFNARYAGRASLNPTEWNPFGNSFGFLAFFWTEPFIHEGENDPRSYLFQIGYQYSEYPDFYYSVNFTESPQMMYGMPIRCIRE